MKILTFLYFSFFLALTGQAKSIRIAFRPNPNIGPKDPVAQYIIYKYKNFYVDGASEKIDFSAPFEYYFLDSVFNITDPEYHAIKEEFLRRILNNFQKQRDHQWTVITHPNDDLTLYYGLAPKTLDPKNTAKISKYTEIPDFKFTFTQTGKRQHNQNEIQSIFSQDSEYNTFHFQAEYEGTNPGTTTAQVTLIIDRKTVLDGNLSYDQIFEMTARMTAYKIGRQSQTFNAVNKRSFE